MDLGEMKLVEPCFEDGMAINRLVEACAPLDSNSVYCNLLQAGHFNGTSVAAKRDNALQGFISGYLIPKRQNCLFIWQVAVAESARGQGLALRMLLALLAREACTDVQLLETTITRSNEASWALFRRLAVHLNAPLTERVMFDKAKHFDHQHDTEYLVQIGPF
ncbi:diaminobutyrate acetyltransferase [Marinomonas epiphytica]